MSRELSNILRIDQLEFLRVTSLRVFEDCPYTWAAQWLGGNKSGDTDASKIGTAAHTIIEHFIRALWCLDDVVHDDAKAWGIIPAPEQDKLYNYLDAHVEMHEKGYRLRCTEREVEGFMPGVDLPIRGHIDAEYDTPSGAILIEDHKTNRDYDPHEWWRQQLQQLLYAWMVRQENPGRRIIFRIGYPNLNRSVEWETDPADDVQLEARIQNIWAEMHMHQASGNWPKRVNDKCKWCPVRGNCSEYELATKRFLELFQQRVAPKSIGEQLEFVQAVKAMIAGKEAELKTQLMAMVETAPGGKLRQGDKIWAAEHGSRRVISAGDAFGVIQRQISAVPELGPIMQGRLDDIFTVKVGEVDRLMKDTDGFGEFARFTSKKKNADKTLKVVPAGKLPTITTLSLAGGDTEDADAPF